jgi:uncharacterized membrane protein
MYAGLLLLPNFFSMHTDNSVLIRIELKNQFYQFDLSNSRFFEFKRFFWSEILQKIG